VVGDAQRLRSDGQRRVDGGRGGQEAAVDDEQVAISGLGIGSGDPGARRSTNITSPGSHQDLEKGGSLLGTKGIDTILVGEHDNAALSTAGI